MTTPEIKNNQSEIKGRGGRRPGAGRPKRGVESRCKGCVALEADIARLKKLLAAANNAMVGHALKPEVAAPISGQPGLECIHGGIFGRCRNLGCRAK